MTDTALAAAGMIIAFMVGYWIGRRDAPKPPNSRLPYQAWITPTHMVRLHYIGSLDEKLAKWLANYILDGHEFSGPSLQRKFERGGKLSENQFNGCRDELVSRHMAERNTQMRVKLHPSAFSLFRMIAGRKKEGTRNGTQEREWRIENVTK